MNQENERTLTAINPDKEFIAGLSLRDFKEYCQRQNEEDSKQTVEKIKPQPQKQKGLFGLFIELLIAPFRRFYDNKTR